MPDFIVILVLKMTKNVFWGDLNLKFLYFRVETAIHTQIFFGGYSLKQLLVNSMKCN